jgi:hypothetical protein
MVRHYCKYNCQCDKCKGRRARRRESAARTRENARAARNTCGAIGFSPWGQQASISPIKTASIAANGIVANGDFDSSNAAPATGE